MNTFDRKNFNEQINTSRIQYKIKLLINVNCTSITARIKKNDINSDYATFVSLMSEYSSYINKYMFHD